MSIQADLLAQCCPKEMVPVPWPGRPTPSLLQVLGGPMSCSPGDQQKAPWLLFVVCELFWVSDEEETEEGEWHGFVQGVGKQWGASLFCQW